MSSHLQLCPCTYALTAMSLHIQLFPCTYALTAISLHIKLCSCTYSLTAMSLHYTPAPTDDPQYNIHRSAVRRHSFDSQAVRLVFVADKVARGQVFLRALPFCPISIIPSVPHILNHPVHTDTVSLKTRTVHVNSACQQCMSTVHFNSAFQQCISTVHVNSAFQQCISTVHANSACRQCMSTVHFNSACQQCMSTVHVNSACQQCISSVHFNSACQQCMSTVYVNGACQQCMSTNRNEPIQLSQCHLPTPLSVKFPPPNATTCPARNLWFSSPGCGCSVTDF
jgi:hypothetical protein